MRGQTAPSPIPTFASQSPGETSRHLGEILAKLKLTPAVPAPIDARVASVRFGSASVAQISFGAKMRLEAEVPQDSHNLLMMFCLRGSGVVTIDGYTSEINIHQGVISRPRDWVRADFSQDCERLLIKLPEETSPRMQMDYPEAFNSTSPHIRSSFDQVTAILKSPSLVASLQSNTLLAQTMQQLLNQLFRAGQHTGIKSCSSKSIASGCVVRAEAFIRSNFKEPIQLCDIAQAAQVPPRTLQNNFRRYRSYTPMQYLRDQRLDLAHKRLKQSGPDDKVVDIAFQCGITHLGRFASEYEVRYGELPSKTRRQAITSQIN